MNDVTNHQPFTITPATSQILSQFDSTQSGITIKNNLEQTAVTGGTIDFKDPWLIDYADSVYGSSMRNRGMEAPFKSRTAPFYPDVTTSYSGDVYKGVFLNQGADWQPPYYSVQTPQTQNINLGSPQGTRTFYFQNWSGTNATLQDANSLTTGVVFTNANATVSANYKGHLLSNNSIGFSSNSQRKFISDVNGNKHLVYESQGSVYYTKSTDNGSTWQQDVKLNEDGTQAKSAVAAASSDGYLYLLYQCDNDAYGNPIPALILSQYYYGNFRWQTNVCDLSSYAFNTMPTISSVSGVVMVVYKPSATSGLASVEYYLSSGNIAETHVRNIPGTTQSSVNPSLATTVLTQPTKHMLVYQESYYGIYYKQWTVATDFGNLVTSNLSSGVGYSLNYTPSIVDVTTGSRLCWVGSDYSGTNKRVVFRDPENLYQFWTFGNYVASPSINRTDNYTAYFIGWSDGSGSSFKIVDSHLSYLYIKTLTGLQGNAMQLSNGSSANAMYAMTFYNGGLPYPLTQSNSLASYYSLSKENTNSNIASGRAGIVMKGDGEFSFMLGDIEVNSEKIRFKKLSDTLTIPSKDVFNTLVESEPFELNENSDFTYSVEYGVTDSALATQALQNGENVKFKVELIDAATNQIINTFDNVTYTKDFLQKYNSLAYQVNTEAIGTMNVKLRLVADHTGEANYQINNSFVEDEIIAKKGFKVINLKNELQIKDYALAQNYPNPFNPATTITYQLPKSGSVTLKIFDILGNEVKTLVNEQKEMGRYTVQFDASSLASGMYVYQLRANDYTSTKKMMLLK
ncbi:MAG: T9SS type A sorting domain-containing protein [Ignavibacteria bacterium]|nr:T9SS type A sorting domain-containing protein [Ignavibacteria bacterium]